MWERGNANVKNKLKFSPADLVIFALILDWSDSFLNCSKTKSRNYISAGTHHMEHASPIQALGVNPFPSKFINRTIPWGGFAR